jgi:hypothetical protein
VDSRNDQVTISGIKPGRTEVKLTGEVLKIEVGISDSEGQTVAYKATVAVRVTGQDLSGQWVYKNGDLVTIVHQGKKVTLQDLMTLPWEGTYSNGKIELSHTYVAGDVGNMDPKWPTKVQQQMVGKQRRITATVKTANDGQAVIVGQLHGLSVSFTEKKQDVTMVKERIEDIELRRKNAAAKTALKP